jgi:hypothetical protein
VADLGSHIVSLARYVVGDIVAVAADLSTKIGERSTAAGTRRPVEVDDEARALVRFANGATGTLEASWIATGRKMYLAFELTGSKGSICLDMERMNELKLFIRGGKAGREGYIEIPAGPAHPDYAPFCPAPGHQLGFNEIKAIEVKAIAEALAGGPTFAAGFPRGGDDPGHRRCHPALRPRAALGRGRRARAGGVLNRSGGGELGAGLLAPVGRTSPVVPVALDAPEIGELAVAEVLDDRGDREADEIDGAGHPAALELLQDQ